MFYSLEYNKAINCYTSSNAVIGTNNLANLHNNGQQSFTASVQVDTPTPMYIAAQDRSHP